MIEYRHGAPLDLEDIVRVFQSSGIRRPVDDRERIAVMFQHANLTVSAWDGATLVGVCRALTDFAYCCYVSDLAVAGPYQHRGVGHRLLQEVRDRLGDQVAMILLSAPEAMAYYPKVGFEAASNAFIIRRAR